jgi:phosphatidylserine decarboxylase
MSRRVWLSQHLLPKNLLSALVYRATRSRRRWLVRPLTRWFARTYRVDLAEAAVHDLDSFETFNEFSLVRSRTVRDRSRAVPVA